MSTLSETYEDDPINLQHIKPIDFNSHRIVPESHVWPHSDDQASLDYPFSIPVIDLTDPNIVDSLGQACETWGVFQVINHGIPMSLLEGAEFEARRLFSLSSQEKLRVLRLPGGATGYGNARITPFFLKHMWHEGFTIMGSSCVDHAKVLWPRDNQGFCNVMDKYQHELKTLAHRLLLIILKALDLSKDEMELATTINNSHADALQLNSYPPCPEPNRAIGLAPHTDSLLFTILHQSHIHGLEIFRDRVGWVPLRAVPRALTVNIGDLLHIYTNARFPTVYHRVVLNRMCHRISIAYFYSPQVDSIVAPFSKIKLPIYRPVMVKEYLSMKSKHLHTALSLIRT